MTVAIKTLFDAAVRYALTAPYSERLPLVEQIEATDPLSLPLLPAPYQTRLAEMDVDDSACFFLVVKPRAGTKLLGQPEEDGREPEVNAYVGQYETLEAAMMMLLVLKKLDNKKRLELGVYRYEADQGCHGRVCGDVDCGGAHQPVCPEADLADMPPLEDPLPPLPASPPPEEEDWDDGLPPGVVCACGDIHCR